MQRTRRSPSALSPDRLLIGDRRRNRGILLPESLVTTGRAHKVTPIRRRHYWDCLIAEQPSASQHSLGESESSDIFELSPAGLFRYGSNTTGSGPIVAAMGNFQVPLPNLGSAENSHY